MEHQQDSFKKEKGIRLSVGMALSFVFFILLTAALLSVVFYFVGRESVLKEKAEQTYTTRMQPEEHTIVSSAVKPQDSVYPDEQLAQSSALSVPAGSIAASNVDPVEKKSVENYFFVINSILSKTKTWEDPQIFARELLKSIMSGDTKSYDSFLENYNKTIESVNSVKAPPACVTHRQGVIDTLKTSYGVLTSIKKAVSSGDSSSLMNIANKAQALKVEAEKLEKLEEGIKKRYGIPLDDEE